MRTYSLLERMRVRMRTYSLLERMRVRMRTYSLLERMRVRMLMYSMLERMLDTQAIRQACAQGIPKYSSKYSSMRSMRTHTVV